MKTRQQYETSLLNQFKIREQNKKVTCELCLKSATIRYHYFKTTTGGTDKRPLYKHFWVCADCGVDERGEHNDE